MRRLWVGMLVASLPLAVLAQNLDQRPLRDDQIAPAQMPPDDQPATEGPATPDGTVTSAPLPPPSDNSTDSSQEMVPNPLDNPDTQPSPGGSKPARPPQGQPQRGTWVQMGSVTLQALDKVNAIAKTLVVKVGDTGHFGSLDIAVRGCFVRAADLPADATAFLVIRDHRPDAPNFTGWMVRSAPSMSMLAHPIFDVRVTGCTP
jgi:hypothetical protein